MAADSVHGGRDDFSTHGSSHADGSRPEGGGAARATLLTPIGRGALAVVAVAGPMAERIVTRLFTPRGGPLAGRPDGAIVFGRWTGDAGGAAGTGEDLVVVRRGADDLEIHCHGGLAAAEAVLVSLERQGAVRQPWPAWLRAGGMAEIDAEAREALAAVGGPKAARMLTRQLAGALEAEFVRVRSLLQAGRRVDARHAIDRLLRAARVGLRLVRPWRVVLIGSVNAGKSSLVNALAGYARSIVSPEPGTTRDLLETRIVLDGWEVDLVDTAGLRDAGPDAFEVSMTERAGIDRAVAAGETADLVLRVIDGRHVDADGSAACQRHELRVATKVDLADAAAPVPAGTWRTSVVTGEGIAALATGIVRRLVPEEVDEPGLFAGAVPFTDRQVRLVESLRDAAASAANKPDPPGAVKASDSRPG
jgi:tRNA modification GTPase